MILKKDIEQAWLAQLEYLSIKKPYIIREYLKNIPLTGKHIEVISGIRRCGKSTLMKQIIEKGYKKIAYFNFEDSRIFGFELDDFNKLDEIIGRDIEAYFFDEIQNVPQWEIFIRQLHDLGNKVYITGSNASLLSKELGTRLTGRNLRHELFPFSYFEFLKYKKLDNNLTSFDKYMQYGGFPEFLESENPEILQNLLKDIVLRDIAIRYGIRNVKSLMDLTLYLISNIGKEITYNSLKKIFNIGSASTVSDYLSWLEDSFVFFYLHKFSYSAKNRTVNPRKVYSIDNGLITSNSLSFTHDHGRLLENLVYQFLMQKKYSLYYFRENKECDFVVFHQKKCLMLIQVCLEINSDNKTRELDGLLEAMLFFKMDEGIIITKNQKDTLRIGGYKINLVPANYFFKNEKGI